MVKFIEPCGERPQVGRCVTAQRELARSCARAANEGPGDIDIDVRSSELVR